MEAALDIEAPSESVIRQLADIERLAEWVPKFRATMKVRRAGWRSFGGAVPTRKISSPAMARDKRSRERRPASWTTVSVMERPSALEGNLADLDAALNRSTRFF